MKSQTCDRHRQVNSMSFGWAWRARWRISCDPVPHSCALALWMLSDCFLSEWFIARRPLDAILAWQQTGSSPWRDPHWADTVIIVAQRHSGPYGVFTPLVHVCEQCATQKELDGAKTQVICPGCSRTLFVPYQWRRTDGDTAARLAANEQGARSGG